MVKDVLGNGGQLTLIAGPCVIENEDLVFEVASRFFRAHELRLFNIQYFPCSSSRLK